MKLKHLIAGAILAGAAVATTPAAAYDIAISGRTQATPRLAADVLTTISRYSKATGGCSFVASVNMRVLPAAYTPTASRARGGHAEEWLVNVCAAKQRFRVVMTPSRRGGTDYVVEPLTGRMPLYAG